MRAYLKVVFELNASHKKCKRAKSLILNKLQGSFKDDYNRLEAYANELRINNHGSNIVINLSKDALMEAWAVVGKDTKRTWGWFLGLLKMSLELNMGEGYIFISDMQKGLLEAMNVSSRKPTIESFNAWILDARYKPIITMLEDIRLKVLNMLREHDERVRAWTADFSPHCMRLYSDYLRIAHSCVVHCNGDFGYEIVEGGDRHIVSLESKKFTCRTWQLFDIPCPHAIKALMYKRIDSLTEIHWWYNKEATLKTYSYKLHPVRGDKFWKIDPSQAMEPPQIVKLASRPKVKRNRAKDEAINR